MFFKKSVECTSCHETFKTTKMISSKARIYKTDTDFCTHAENAHPMYYDVHVCPHCGFAGIERFRPILKRKKAVLKENYLDKVVPMPELCEERTVDDAIKAYKLALYASELLGEPLTVQASCTMKIAWLNRFKGDEGEDRRFLSKSLELYTKAMEHEDLSRQQVNESKLIYLIAELNTRVGDYAVARRWFSHLMTDKTIEPKYRTLAVDRWNDYKMEMEEAK